MMVKKHEPKFEVTVFNLIVDMRYVAGSHPSRVIPKTINGTNCLPAWHASVRVGIWQCNPTVR